MQHSVYFVEYLSFVAAVLQKSLQYANDCNMVLLQEEDVEAHTSEIFVHKFKNMVDHFLMAVLKLHPWMQM